MSRTATVRQYGKPTRRSRAERLFAELPQSPVRRPARKSLAGGDDAVGKLSELVAAVRIGDGALGEEDVEGEGGTGVEEADDSYMDQRPPRTRSRRDAGARSRTDDTGGRTQRTRSTKDRDTRDEKKAEHDDPGGKTRRTRSTKDRDTLDEKKTKDDDPSGGATKDVVVLDEKTDDDSNSRERSSSERTRRTRSTKDRDALDEKKPEEDDPSGKTRRTRSTKDVSTRDKEADKDGASRRTRRTRSTKVTGAEEVLETEPRDDNYETVTAQEPPTVDTKAPDTSSAAAATEDDSIQKGLRILSWDDVCAFPDTIVKIAEASYAEVYRVTNPRGTSIIKVIRLTSPIRAQTKAQVRSGLVDEEPHDPGDLVGELRISEWLADIPGFVVYKDRYVVRGRAPKALVETHQALHRKMKRKDPDRLQFYPSPSRYLEETRFLVVELGDAGTALEDFKMEDVHQVWDVFLLVAIALARAEDLVLFEHRDLHEGNLCIKQVGEPQERDPEQPDLRFGYSGLDITILDYGLSRAEDPGYADEDGDDDHGDDDHGDDHGDGVVPVAYDLEKDLGIFTSTHAAQCAVYRRMRSFLLRGDRKNLPPRSHTTPYATAFDGEPICWTVFAPYTNVLWLAYIYQYLVDHFRGEKKEVARFRKETAEMWSHLDPGAKEGVPCFGSAGDVVRFAVESGWLLEGQVMGEGSSILAEREDSIIMEGAEEGGNVRRSPRGREA